LFFSLLTGDGADHWPCAFAPKTITSPSTVRISVIHSVCMPPQATAVHFGILVPAVPVRGWAAGGGRRAGGSGPERKTRFAIVGGLYSITALRKTGAEDKVFATCHLFLD
jgi:hypothetical protein